MTEISHLQIARERIEFARSYTLEILTDIPDADWFRMPNEGVTHIAWQVGHLAMAQYRLVMERLRETRPEDEQLISADFLEKFGKGSVPQADASFYPTPTEIREVAQRVHQQVLKELEGYTDQQLQADVLKPHMLLKKKIDSLFWCAEHELTHAGQISLLRRLLGSKPKW